MKPELNLTEEPGGNSAATATTEKSSVVGDAAKLPKTVDTRFDICKDIALVLKIGRDYQNKDGYRGAHYDTVKLLCDAIEYQQEQLETKTKVGDASKLREALVQCELFLGYVSRHGHPTLNPGDKCTACSDADKLREMVVRALSAPPRNCDKYNDEVLASQAFMEARPYNCYAWSCADLIHWILNSCREEEASGSK